MLFYLVSKAMAGGVCVDSCFGGYRRYRDPGPARPRYRQRLQEHLLERVVSAPSAVCFSKALPIWRALSFGTRHAFCSVGWFVVPGYA